MNASLTEKSPLVSASTVMKQDVPSELVSS